MTVGPLAKMMPDYRRFALPAPSAEVAAALSLHACKHGRYSRPGRRMKWRSWRGTSGRRIWMRVAGQQQVVVIESGLKCPPWTSACPLDKLPCRMQTARAPKNSGSHLCLTVSYDLGDINLEYAKKYFLPLILVVLVACSWFNPFDSVATEKVDAGLKRALISFATARTLNAVISVAQGTDVAFEPAGIGVKFAPGQILDPINDLIEKFSTLMLAATISFGIQHVLIKIGGHWLISALLTTTVFVWASLYLRQMTIPGWVSKLLVITIVLRFAIPTVTMGTDVLFQTFLVKEYASSQKFIETGTLEAKGALPQPNLPENLSVWDKMKNISPPDINISAKLAKFVQAAERWPEQIIRLMVVFMMETLIIPVTLLLLLVSFARSYLSVGPQGLPRLKNITPPQ